MSARRLIANTMLRILTRDQQPHTVAYLAKETELLVSHLLPDGYNTLGAVRVTASTSDEISWQGLSTYRLKQWDTALDSQNMATARGRTGDLIYTFLTQHGTADIEAVIEHVQKNSKAKRRTVQEAINHDHAQRFSRTPDGCVAANPIRRKRDSDASELAMVPDGNATGLGPSCTNPNFFGSRATYRH